MKIIVFILGLLLASVVAVNVFASMVVQERGLPFDVKLPNDKTLKAMKEAEEGIGETVSFEDFLEESKIYAKSL